MIQSFKEDFEIYISVCFVNVQKPYCFKILYGSCHEALTVRDSLKYVFAKLVESKYIEVATISVYASGAVISHDII